MKMMNFLQREVEELYYNVLVGQTMIDLRSPNSLAHTVQLICFDDYNI